jgi:hypothetical protein
MPDRGAPALLAVHPVFDQPDTCIGALIHDFVLRREIEADIPKPFMGLKERILFLESRLNKDDSISRARVYRSGRRTEALIGLLPELICQLARIADCGTTQYEVVGIRNSSRLKQVRHCALIAVAAKDRILAAQHDAAIGIGKFRRDFLQK